MESVAQNPLLAIWDLIVLTFYTAFSYLNAFFRLIFPPSLKSLEGEVVLITGSAKGIGREICLRLASHNLKLVCWDRNAEDNEELVNTLKEMGSEAFSYVVDVSDRLKVESVANKVKSEVGNVTVLINNAGIMPCRQFLKMNPAELENIFKVNVYGNFWTLREFLPDMISKGKGHIVTLCSAAGIIPTRNLAAYCGSKFALNGFIESLKNELKHLPKNPRINFTTVYPFSCNTGLLSGVRSHSRFPWIINTVIEPEDVADKVVEGLRRNYEHVYIPNFVQFAGTYAKALLPQVQDAAADFMNCYVEPTTEEKNE